MKKLQNVKKDHDKRLTNLTKNQKVDKEKAELITLNQKLVDSAILAIQSAIANQVIFSIFFNISYMYIYFTFINFFHFSCLGLK